MRGHMASKSLETKGLWQRIWCTNSDFYGILKLRHLWHTNPDFYAIWAVCLGGWGRSSIYCVCVCVCVCVRITHSVWFWHGTRTAQPDLKKSQFSRKTVYLCLLNQAARSEKQSEEKTHKQSVHGIVLGKYVYMCFFAPHKEWPQKKSKNKENATHQIWKQLIPVTAIAKNYRKSPRGIISFKGILLRRRGRRKL